MINYDEIQVQKLDDYDELKTKINPIFMHEKVIRELKERIGLSINRVIIEFPYHDSDYLSTYYIFYSKKHRSFLKHNYRLHFMYGDEYLGFITLRPTSYYTKIGRSVLSPKILLNENAYVMTSSYKSNILGESTIVDAFPWMYQETDIAVCAHVSIWSVLKYYGNKYTNYKSINMADVISKTPEYISRGIPSKGLNVIQIPEVLKNYGFAPVVIQKMTGVDFYSEIFAYIESGIPLIGILTGKNHAVTIVGHGKVDYSKLDGVSIAADEHIKNTSLFDSIIVNDDNFFPYIEVGYMDNGITGYTISDFDYAIVPLYDRMQVEFATVEVKIDNLIRSHEFDYIDNKVVRIYMTSARSFKKKVKQSDINISLKNTILRMTMPKFIWCADISSADEYEEGLVRGRVIIDSTCCTYEENPWLLIQKNSEIIFRDDEVWKVQNETIESYSRYVNNLKEVEV